MQDATLVIFVLLACHIVSRPNLDGTGGPSSGPRPVSSSDSYRRCDLLPLRPVLTTLGCG